MAKNKMRRCFGAILDPHPSKVEVTNLWDYFGHACAYCGQKLDRSGRNGHLDHVVPSSEGGTNSIYNHVLSCARCNGDEKREESWESFLRRRVPDSAKSLSRKQRIESWLSQAPSQSILDSERRREAEAIVSEALESFDAAVEKLRTLRSGA